MIGEWSRKISNQICENQNEKEIIQYGLNQLFWILLNFFAIAISGVLWHEFCFSILVFLEIYFLRPYAGGYHADTEIKDQLPGELPPAYTVFSQCNIPFPRLFLYISDFVNCRPFFFGYSLCVP